MTGSQTSPPPHAWAIWELKEKAKQILVIGRNYCQPVLWSRASLLGRSDIFKCKWTPSPTSTFFSSLISPFASAVCRAPTCLCMQRLGPSLSEWHFVPALFQPLCHAPLKWTHKIHEPWYPEHMWSQKNECVVSFLQSTPTYLFP